MPKNTQRHRTASSSESSIERLTDLITRSQRGYRELIDHVDQALFTLSLQGEIRVANLRLSQIVGASFQDLIGHRLSEFVESPSAAEMERALPELVRAGAWSGTIPVRLKRDKDLRHFQCWLQAVEDEGQSTAVIGWARDVTAQHESETRFSELFESLSEGIVFTTPEGRILDANPALVRMLGYQTKQELLQRNIAEIYDDPRARQGIIRILEERGSIRNNEVVLRRKDGKQVHCLSSGLALRDASGRVVRLQGTLVDVTERIEIERQLHREQQFVRRLIEYFPDMIAVLDREGRFTYLSERARDVLGVPPQEYLGRTIGGATHTEDRKYLVKMMQEVLDGRSEHSQIESRVRHADGSWRTLRTAARPMLDEEGRIIGLVASVRDVTELSLAEHKTAQREKLAAMGQMLAGAAHELNNPLTAILGVSDLLRERATDDATRRQVDLVLQQARRAAAILHNLLAFSRPAAQGRGKLRLDEVLREVLRGQSAALKQKNITVKFDPPPEVPLVEGDRRLLSQVFSNLVINAEQSIALARDHGAIEISLRDLKETVCVTVSDDGSGISSENISKIFDPFFTTKRPGGGTGLGLTICLAVAKDHGGTIEVTSTPGAGAAFHVFFPVAGGENGRSPQQARPTAKSTPSGPETLAGRTVLVVDDEESIRDIIQEGLSLRQMKVHAVESCERALAYMQANTCDMVICDFNLPGMSGEKFLEFLSTDRRTAQLPQFVFITGDLVDAELSERLRQKGSSVLQKPFHMDALAVLLADLLQPKSSSAS
jgi:PAS domain S-box-containing protein